jgi:hypothetical protein
LLELLTAEGAEHAEVLWFACRANFRFYDAPLRAIAKAPKGSKAPKEKSEYL